MVCLHSSVQMPVDRSDCTANAKISVHMMPAVKHQWYYIYTKVEMENRLSCLLVHIQKLYDESVDTYLQRVDTHVKIFTNFQTLYLKADVENLKPQHLYLLHLVVLCIFKNPGFHFKSGALNR